MSYREDLDPTGQGADAMYDLERDLEREREMEEAPRGEAICTYCDTLLTVPVGETRYCPCGGELVAA